MITYMTVVSKMIGSVILTHIFDVIRDKQCSLKNNCDCSIELSANPQFKLDANWKMVLLSYNYAYVYGYLCSKLFIEHNVITRPMKYFVIISFLQRIMCAFVMNGIHHNTSPIVHAGYYFLYFLGSMKNIHYNQTYTLISIISVISSLINMYVSGNQNNYSWKKQYKNKKLIHVHISDKNNLFYEQPYSVFEYYHLRTILVLHLILYTYEKSHDHKVSLLVKI